MSCRVSRITPCSCERAGGYCGTRRASPHRWPAVFHGCLQVVWLLVMMVVGPQSAFSQATSSFFNQIGTATDMSAADACASSFSSELTGEGLIERPSSEIETMMRECVEDLSSPDFARECNLQAAMGQVDYVIVYNVSREGDEWYFHIEALSPMQQGTVWQQGTLVAESRAVRGAMMGCRELAQDFLVRQSFVEPDDRRSRRRRQDLMAAVEIVSVIPTPVTVYVNGTQAGIAPGTFDVPADELVELELRSPGHFALVETVEVSAGTILTLPELRLTAWPATIEVHANVDDAQIRLEGELVGSTLRGRTFTVSVSPGEYEVEVSRDGFAQSRTTVDVGPGEVVAVMAELVAVVWPIFPVAAAGRGVEPESNVMASPPPETTFRLSCRGQRALGGVLTAVGIGLTGYGSYLNAVARVTRSPGEPWEDEILIPERRASGVGLLLGGLGSGSLGVWQIARGCR